MKLSCIPSFGLTYVSDSACGLRINRVEEAAENGLYWSLNSLLIRFTRMPIIGLERCGVRDSYSAHESDFHWIS